MNIKFPSIEKIKANEKITKNRLNSAKRIWKDVKVDYITPKHIGFTSWDKLHNTKHSVIYFDEKKYPLSWNCDCHWHSIKSGLCKHIISVFIRLNKDKKFLKKFRKTIL